MKYSERVITREAVCKIDNNYAEILDNETHHNHKIVMDEAGTLRWKEKPVVNEMVDAIGLNEIVSLLYSNGFNKNSEIYRKIYRGLGYSLSGYWEIFYWSVNNELCDEYRNEIKEKK